MNRWTIRSIQIVQSDAVSTQAEMSQSVQDRNKEVAIKAFETLFNKRDYVEAEKFWAADRIQHASHLKVKDGVFVEHWDVLAGGGFGGGFSERSSHVW